MAKSIREILKPLAPHWARIVRLPLSKSEVQDIERRVGLKAPTLLRDFLLKVGLFQELTHGIDSSIKFFDDPCDFPKERQFLVSLALARPTDLFPFGHDGMGNIYALSAAERENPYIYFVSHETRKPARKARFSDWLQQTVQRVIRRVKRWPLNDRKAWHVEFTFDGISFDELKKVISEAGRVQVLDSRWKCVERTTQRKVGESRRRIQFDGELLTICHSKCRSWDMLSFIVEEPIDKMIKRSTIRRLNALFKKRFQEYALINYGPLDLDNREG